MKLISLLQLMWIPSASSVLRRTAESPSEIISIFWPARRLACLYVCKITTARKFNPLTLRFCAPRDKALVQSNSLWCVFGTQMLNSVYVSFVKCISLCVVCNDGKFGYLSGYVTLIIIIVICKLIPEKFHRRVNNWCPYQLLQCSKENYESIGNYRYLNETL